MDLLENIDEDTILDMIKVYTENGQKYLVVNNQKIINILDDLSKSLLLKDHEVIKMTP